MRLSSAQIPSLRICMILSVVLVSCPLLLASIFSLSRFNVWFTGRSDEDPNALRNRIKELKHELSSKNKELQRIVDFEETYSSQNTTESEARNLSKNYSLNRLAASIAYQNRQYISELKIDNELLRRELDRMRNYLNLNKYDNHMEHEIDEDFIKM